MRYDPASRVSAELAINDNRNARLQHGPMSYDGIDVDQTLRPGARLA